MIPQGPERQLAYLAGTGSCPWFKTIRSLTIPIIKLHEVAPDKELLSC